MSILMPNELNNLNLAEINNLLQNGYVITSYLPNSNLDNLLLLLKRQDNERSFVDLLSSYKSDVYFSYADIFDDYMPYQEALQTLVKQITGLDVITKLKYDVIDYFKEYLMSNLDNFPNDNKNKIINRALSLANIFKDEANYARTLVYQEKLNMIAMQKEQAENIYQNLSICKLCGGRCCLNGGCDYLTSDFNNLNQDTLEELLNSGKVAIKALLIQNNYHLDLLLTLKARNINRDIIDLISIETKCANLTINGCSLNYSNRPGFARHLIPNNFFTCQNDLNTNEENLKWLKYQNILEDYLFETTKRNKYEEFRREVKIFFKDVLNHNFNDVSIESVNEAIYLCKYLSHYYPNEYALVENELNRQRILKN